MGEIISNDMVTYHLTTTTVYYPGNLCRGYRYVLVFTGDINDMITFSIPWILAFTALSLFTSFPSALKGIISDKYLSSLLNPNISLIVSTSRCASIIAHRDFTFFDDTWSWFFHHQIHPKVLQWVSIQFFHIKIYIFTNPTRYLACVQQSLSLQIVAGKEKTSAMCWLQFQSHYYVQEAPPLVVSHHSS